MNWWIVMSSVMNRPTKQQLLHWLSPDDPDYKRAHMAGVNTVEYQFKGNRTIRFHHTDIVSIAPDGAVPFVDGMGVTPAGGIKVPG